MKKLLASIFLIICGIVNAQELQPLELVKKVFTDKQFAENTTKYAIGEYEGRPNAKDFLENTDLKFKLLNQSENKAVVNVTIFDSLGNGIDTYCHLKKDNAWKIEAFRGLAMTGVLERLKLEIEKMTEKQIDSFIKTGKEGIESRADLYRQLAFINLTLALDDIIVVYFKENEAKFEELKNKISLIDLDKEEKYYRKINLAEKIKYNPKELLINSISTCDYCANCFEFIIGGMVDNTVGYLYVPKGDVAPEMNPSRIIMLREIGNGWYMFKTT